MEGWEFSDDDDIPLSELSAIGMESSVTFTTECSFRSSASVGVPFASTSTPRKNKVRDKNNENWRNVFRQPEPLLRCPRCNKSYKTTRGLKDHTDFHLYTDASAERLNLPDLESRCLADSKNILDKIGQSPAAVSDGQEFIDLVSQLKEKPVCEDWVMFVKAVAEHLQIISTVKIVLPSHLREQFLISTNKFLNNSDNVENLLGKLQFVNFSSKVKNIFILQYVTESSEAVLVQIFQGMKDKISPAPLSSNKQMSTDNFNSVKTQQVTHYIAGSCVQGFLKRSLKLVKNQHWRKIKEVLCTNFLKDSVPIVSANETEAWTAILNRKKLLFVKDNVLTFFLELAKLLVAMELPHGSLCHRDVQLKVFQSRHLLMLWSDVVQNSLKHDESINLLRNMVKSFTNTFGNGVRMRRMNEVLTPKPASLGLRGHLAASSRQ